MRHHGSQNARCHFFATALIRSHRSMSNSPRSTGTRHHDWNQCPRCGSGIAVPRVGVARCAVDSRVVDLPWSRHYRGGRFVGLSKCCVKLFGSERPVLDHRKQYCTQKLDGRILQRSWFICSFQTPSSKVVSELHRRVNLVEIQPLIYSFIDS